MTKQQVQEAVCRLQAQLLDEYRRQIAAYETEKRLMQLLRTGLRLLNAYATETIETPAFGADVAAWRAAVEKVLDGP